MNKRKLFIDNFLVYGMGGIISKIIPLIMIPIVTKLMPKTDYFGISDLANTVVQFASSVAIMGMYDAMYRLFFEKAENDFKKVVCSTALAFTIVTSIAVFILMLIFKEYISKLFLRDSNYAYVIYISAMSTLIGATNSIISAPTRMMNKRKLYLGINVLGPAFSYSVAIPLLIKGYYVIALPISGLISGLIIELIYGLVNREWFKLRLFDLKILKQLLIIAIPLFPNFIIYWLFNSCDKLMITNLIGIGAEGIYSVGSKLGYASQLIYIAFAGGWQFFAFSTMRDDNQVKQNSNIFEYLGIISFVATSYICIFSHIFFKIFFKTDYYEGFIVAPYLFFSPLLQMLFQVAANQFIVIKKTWPNFFILLSGVFVNLVLNSILIPKFGIEGASIATMMGYVISLIICVCVLKHMKLMIISNKFLMATLVMLIFFTLWRVYLTERFILGFISASVIVFIMSCLYRKDLKKLFFRLIKK